MKDIPHNPAQQSQKKITYFKIIDTYNFSNLSIASVS